MSNSTTTGGFNQYQPSIALSNGIVDWKQGNVFNTSISANQTYSFLNDIDGKTIVLKIKNDGASILTLTWPSNVIGADTTIAISVAKMVTLIKIGSSIYANSVDIATP